MFWKVFMKERMWSLGHRGSAPIHVVSFNKYLSRVLGTGNAAVKKPFSWGPVMWQVRTGFDLTMTVLLVPGKDDPMPRWGKAELGLLRRKAKTWEVGAPWPSTWLSTPTGPWRAAFRLGVPAGNIPDLFLPHQRHGHYIFRVSPK